MSIFYRPIYLYRPLLNDENFIANCRGRKGFYGCLLGRVFISIPGTFRIGSLPPLWPRLWPTLASPPLLSRHPSLTRASLRSAPLRSAPLCSVLLSLSTSPRSSTLSPPPSTIKYTLVKRVSTAPRVRENHENRERDSSPFSPSERGNVVNAARPPNPPPASPDQPGGRGALIISFRRPAKRV